MIQFNLVPRFSLSRSAGMGRREPWERCWAHFRFLRLHSSIDTVSCHLLLQIERKNMD